MMRRLQKIPKFNIKRLYHSYPDPKESPKVLTSLAKPTEKWTNKSIDECKLDEKFHFDKVFPGTPAGKTIGEMAPPVTISSTLANGLTVATQEMPGLMCSFAFIVRTGSSYEIQSGENLNTGSTHLLELNGFRSTNQISHKDLINEIELLGGMVQCISTRENIIYCIDVLRNNASRALDILAQTVLEPSFPDEEIEESKMIVEFQQNELPAEILSRDAVQIASYRGFPLSNTHYCPLNVLPTITANTLREFRNKYIFGSNCVIAASGIDHDSFVKEVEKRFNTMPVGSRTAKHVKRTPSIFTGGLYKNERELKEPFVRVAIAFEVGGWNDELLIPIYVLQQLLGGGSSFSAGGPGKGMYTRLYTQVLNKYYWTESIESFVTLHEENGLFGIDGSCAPDHVQLMMRVIIDQLTLLAYNKVSSEELNRAKNMLKSTLMMQLESRLVLCEDIARQFITYGKREDPSTICNKIDNVNANDLIQVAQRMLKSPSAVGCVGHDLSNVPSYEQIHAFVMEHRKQSSKINWSLI